MDGREGMALATVSQYVILCHLKCQIQLASENSPQVDLLRSHTSHGNGQLSVTGCWECSYMA